MRGSHQGQRMGVQCGRPAHSAAAADRNAPAQAGLAAVDAAQTGSALPLSCAGRGGANPVLRARRPPTKQDVTPCPAQAQAAPQEPVLAQAEAAMRALVADAHPEHGVFGEEGGMAPGAGGGAASEYLWIFDPIDGTKSFITGARRILPYLTLS